MQDLYRHLHVDPRLVLELLAVFSRMEYALKSATFANGSEKRVDANWDSFANTIDHGFLTVDDPELIEARNYLLQQPPRKQVLSDGKLDFADQTIDPNQSTTQQLLLMVRTVRNNLFHGGKYSPDGEREAGRNEQLVRYAIRILLACSVLDERVQLSFEH